MEISLTFPSPLWGEEEGEGVKIQIVDSWRNLIIIMNINETEFKNR